MALTPMNDKLVPQHKRMASGSKNVNKPAERSTPKTPA